MKTKSLWTIELYFLALFLVSGVCFLLSVGQANQVWTILFFGFAFAAITVQVIISWRRNKWVRWRSKEENDGDNLWPKDANQDRYWSDH